MQTLEGRCGLGERGFRQQPTRRKKALERRDEFDYSAFGDRVVVHIFLGAQLETTAGSEQPRTRSQGTESRGEVGADKYMRAVSRTKGRRQSNETVTVAVQCLVGQQAAVSHCGSRLPERTNELSLSPKDVG